MPGGGPKDCPNCGTPNVESSLFCEACGYDFTTGALPAGVVTNVEAPPAEAPAPGARSPELAQVEVDNAVENLGADPDPQPSNPAGEALESSGAAEQAAEAEGMGAAAGIRASSVGSGSGVPPRIAFQWVAEVWIDPDWYADQQAQEPLPSAGLPLVVPLRIASALIGRESASRQIHPDIDCSTDPGVSRRHAQLTTDGSRWFVEDLQSANGTFIGAASGPLPDDPIPVGPKTEVGDQRIYVGAWTRIVVRRATDEEIAIG